MRASTKVLLFLLVVGWLSVKAGTLFKANGDFSEHVDRQLNSVGDVPADSIKQEIVADAGKLGIEAGADDIVIGFEDTDKQTVPQRLVGATVARFINKIASIHVNYRLRFLGIPIRQEISTHKIRTIQVLPPARDPALDEPGNSQ